MNEHIVMPPAPNVRQSRVGIVIATYGAPSWERLARTRAVPSAEEQMFRTEQGWHQVRVMQYHGSAAGFTNTLASARNFAASQIAPYCDWLIFLDGDDQLDHNYVKAMLALDPEPNELIVPAVQYTRAGRAQAPKFWPEQDHHDGNWLIIGTMVPVGAFLEVGGFKEYGMYEDWALFASMQDLGYVPRKCPDAVYVAHRSARSRNNAGHVTRLYWHQRIGHDLWPELYDAPSENEDARQRLNSRHVRRMTTL